MISGIIFDYGGTIDSRGEHWSEVIWRGWQRAGIRATKQAFRDSYVYAERYLARHPVILPSDDFRTLLLKKITIELNHYQCGRAASALGSVAAPPPAQPH